MRAFPALQFRRLSVVSFLLGQFEGMGRVYAFALEEPEPVFSFSLQKEKHFAIKPNPFNDISKLTQAV